MGIKLTERLQITVHRSVGKLGYGLAGYTHAIRSEKWQAVTSVTRAISTTTTPLECAEIFQAAKSCDKLDGDMAEAGVYLGATAAIMLSASASKPIHLFDTFEGLPASEGRFSKGEWRGTLADVRHNLEPWSGRTEFHPGLFPASADGLDHLRFSFVHLDLDLYQSTIDALRWFWPRMVTGGAVLSHDYPTADGVLRAFHEFFDSRVEPFLPLSGNQCIAFKTA